jgi:sugar transferase (PEP-CTERM/EpsH1 system associated)
LKKVRDLVRREGIEAAVVFSSSMAQYVESFGTMIRVMNFCDLDSQKWADLAAGAPWFRRWLYRREADLLLEYERRIAAAFSSSCVVTENEAVLFRKLIPGTPVQVLPNGVDHDYFGTIERMSVGLRFAFIGVMDYEPNVEAVEYFCREVWPHIVSRFPSGRFSIVGSRPNRRVSALAGVTGVTVTGMVPDVRAYLATATMVVVPLKVARGIQNKVLEAMAAGVPVLATPASVSGLPDSAREVLFIADRSKPGAFLGKISEMLDNRQAMEARATEAQAFVQAHYSWEKSGRILESLLVEAKAARAARTQS